MAKRTRSADIAEVGALIFRRPPAGADAAAPDGAAANAADATAEGAAGTAGAAEAGTGLRSGAGEAAPGARGPGARVPGGQLATHPATADRADRRARRDVFDLDPRRIVERGPYIREWDESGEAFERLVAAVAARGEVDTPIWVRSSGPAGQRTFVLVAGKGRLRAAVRNALPVVPVRDLGELTDQQAVARQLEENLNRQDMTPAQTAHALYVTHGFGESISDIGRRLHRDKGYVSYMVRVGEALDALAPEERSGLARPGVLQVRQCQAIGALPNLAARVAELRRLRAAAEADGAGQGRGGEDGDEARGPDARGAAGAGDRAAPGRPAPRRPDEQTPFYGRPIRNGRTFRMRWVEQDLRADPAGLAEGFVAAVQAEGAQLAAALRRLEAEGGAGAGPDAVARARRAVESLLRG